MTLRSLVLVCAVLAPLPLHAQSEPAAEAAPAEAAPVEAPEAEIEVASRTPLTARDAPNIVSVVQRDEILASGATDLLELLMLVPGFGSGVDVSGVVGLTFRGQWGHEGKILLLLDGQELNETLYSTTQFGTHLPLELVERVEISRGPGSSIYGGFAELAVINVVTRRPRDLNGAAASIDYGRMQGTTGHTTATASWGGNLARAPGVQVSVHLAYSEAQRTATGSYGDFSGGAFVNQGNTGQSDFLADLGLQYGGLKVRLLHDDYRVDTYDGTSAVVAQPDRQRFSTSLVEARYDARPADGLTLTPRLSYKTATPWQVTDPQSEGFYDKSASRLLGGLTAGYEAADSLSLLAGAEAFFDHARLNDLRLIGLQTQFGAADSVDYRTAAGFLQVMVRSFIANLTLGARYEYNSAVGSSFVPRIGLTRVLGRFNFKLLYSQAYRAPGIENLNLNPALQPERTNIVEAEAGVQLGGHVALLVNGYWMRIEQPIVYDFDPATNSERYLNGDHTGSTGVEAQLRVKYGWGFANLSYSFYTTAGIFSADGQNAVALYQVPGHDEVLLGSAPHKLTLQGGLNLRDDVVLGARAVYQSPRFGYLTGDGAGNGVLGTEPGALLLGAALTVRNLGAPGLDLVFGASNLLDSSIRVLQPYNGGHAPLQMAGREVSVKLRWGQAHD